MTQATYPREGSTGRTTLEGSTAGTALRHAGKGLLAITAFLAASLAAATGSHASFTGGEASGGATAPAAPAVSDVICSTGCVALRTATVGGTLQITGQNLSDVDTAIFRGHDGRLAVAVEPGSDTSLSVRVPAGASSGPVRLRDPFGSASRPSSPVTVAPSRALRASGPLGLVSAETRPRRSYFLGSRRPSLSFVISGRGSSSDLRVDVVSSAGEIMQSFFRDDVPHDSVQTVRWNGRQSNGRPAPGGSYRFRVGSQDGKPARANTSLRRQLRSTGRRGSPLAFRMLPYAFPVDSGVSWGDGLGAGRNHQGQDLMASCGVPVRAARGGRVTYRGDMDGAAGNYVVISGWGTRHDFAYMHLLRPVTLEVGDPVRTGQVIGRVGSTGSSSACHLHFEMWSAPGWYKGGAPISPIDHLKRWRRW